MSTTVLYIAGTGRSGSTVLANLLGEADGLFAAGEMRFLWQRGLVESRLCGCGLLVRECPVWTEVLAGAAGGAEPTDPAQLLALLRRTGRLRHVPLAVAGRLAAPLDPARWRGNVRDLATLGRTYAAVARVTGCDVVVDSSKLPAYANLLAAAPGIDLRVVHLIRDPRAAAYSWSTRKALDDGAERTHMEVIGPAKSAVLWDVWNAAASALLDRPGIGYLRLRYEDFVADPATALHRILVFAGRSDAGLPSLKSGEAVLGVNHSVAGNPDRLRHGTVRIRSDDRWRRGLPRGDRRLVSAVTAPLLLRYGYPLRAASVAAGDGGQAATIFDRAPAAESAAARFARRSRRHLRWGRTEGFGRLVEEDELNPVARARTAVDKWRWRKANPLPIGMATPVFLVGLQRSGTNMLARGLDTAPEFEVRNENDREAFDRFRLRPDDAVRRIVLSSRHRFVLFKPLCDSHRVDALLDRLATPSPGRAIWAYRDADGRARSAVSKFGRNNLLSLRDIASGAGASTWQAERVSVTTMEMLQSFDYAAMTPLTAAALFWWVRNSLYFEMGLDHRRDVLLASYQELLAGPRAAMAAICAFLNMDYRDELVAHIAPRAPREVRQLEIDPRVRAACDQLQARLDETAVRQRREWAA